MTPASPAQELWARLITWAYVLGSIVATFLVLTRRLHHAGRTPVEDVFEMLNVPLTASLVSVVGLALLSGALIRRKRIALVVVGAFQAIGALSAVVSSLRLFRPDWFPQYPMDEPERGVRLFALSYELSAFALSVLGLALAIWVRRAFPARLARGSWLGAGAVLLGGTAATILLTHALLFRHNLGRVTNWTILRIALTHSLGLGDPSDRLLLARIPPWIPGLAAFVLSLTLVIATATFLASAQRRGAWSGDTEVRIRRLLADYGERDSLGYFATRRDKEFLFSDDGRAAISYRVIAASSLAAGDPIGDPSSWPSVIGKWLAYSRTYGWVPGVVAASERGARAFADAGLQVLSIGDEAVLETSTFALNSTSLTPVRKAVARVRRSGVEIMVRRHAELSAEELQRVAQLADQWRHGDVERGFSMALNRLGDPADGACVLVSAHRGDEILGLLSFVPWGRHGLSLDLMRRSPEAPNGVTEAMVAGLMGDAETIGVTRVSLNFAVMRRSFAEAERLGAGTVTRINSSVLGFLDRFLQLERLYRSNEKYRPEWIPRFACFDGSLTMPRIGLAAGQAEGFLPAWLTSHDTSHLRLTPTQLEEVRTLELEAPVDLDALGPRRSDQSRIRIEHLDQLRAEGRPPYPIGLGQDRGVAQLDTWNGASTRISGRVRRVRNHGGVVFCDLVDGAAREQAILDRDALGAESLRAFVRLIDTGDLLVVRARRGASRTGTPSLLVEDWMIAAKSVQPIPFDGLDDPDTRLRKRATDLLVHPAALSILRARSTVFASVRRTLASAGFTEVETPILATVHGGASARPFRTHINAYSADLTLRIAPELALKKLLVAGMGAIFEIGRNFRNEGADATHNPEFTSLEAYQPFADYTTMRLLTERLIKDAATAVHGAPLLPLRTAEGDYVLTDVSAPWAVLTMTEAVSQAVGRDVSVATDLDELLELARRHEVAVHDGMGPGAVLEELYADLVEAATITPTFYCDFPVETSPLTGPHRSTPGLTERWDLVANAMEIGTAYSELTDPLEQRRRLTEQSLKAAAGDPEAMELDEDFLLALENGMPPAGGLGIGMDRLVMLLTATTIRDVLTFPFVKPHPSPAAPEVT